MTGHAVSPRLTAIVTLIAIAGCSGIPRGSDWKAERKYGSYMARRGFWHEALFRFQKAAEQQPGDARTQNDLAVAYESVGETSKALEAYKRALALDPHDAHIKRNYARFAEYYTSVQRASAPPSATPGPSQVVPPTPAPTPPLPVPTATPAPVPPKPPGPTPGPVPTGIPAPMPAPTGMPVRTPSPTAGPTPAPTPFVPQDSSAPTPGGRP